MQTHEKMQALDLELLKETLKQEEFKGAIRLFGRVDTAIEIILEEKRAIRAKIDILHAQSARLDALQDKIASTPSLLH